MKRLRIELTCWKCILKSIRFWKRFILILTIVVTSILAIFYIRFAVDYVRSTVQQSVFDRCVVNTQVFLYTIEEMKKIQPDNEEALLQAVQVRVTRYDEEYSVNSLLVDAECHLISQRVVTVPFCDPFEMPVDSYVMFDNVLSGEKSGFYQLHCPDANGDLQPCRWYYQQLDLCGNTYYVLTGLQPTAVNAVIDTDRIYIPTFCFGFIVVVSIWIAVFFATRNWRDKTARTRKDD